jgi:hypothetical protein
MPYPAKQVFTFQDGGLGLAQAAGGYPLVLGCSSGGTDNTLYKFSNSTTALAYLVSGPGVELAAALADQGGCLYGELVAGTAGSLSAVTKTAVSGGTGTGTITVAGSPTNEYYAAVEITATGTVATGRFRYRLDYNEDVIAQSVAGSGWSPEIVIPAGGTYLIPGSGITLTFVPGGGAVFFEDGDLHTFDATGDHYLAANVTTFFAALDDQIGNLYLDQCFFTGVNQSGADAATVAAAIDTAMTGLANKFYFARALMDAGSLDTAADAKTGLVSFTSSRVGVCYGLCHLTTKAPMVGYGTPRLPIMNVLAERYATASLEENAGRKLSGSLRGVSWISHDEDRELAFIEADKINTLLTYRGESGFYSTNGYLKSAMGSDYQYYDWGRVADRAARIIYLAQNPFLLAKLEAKTDGTGNLTESSVNRVESAVRRQLKNGIIDPFNAEGTRGYVSPNGCKYTVDRTNDFLGTRIVMSSCAMVPLSPVEQFSTTIGFARSL